MTRDPLPRLYGIPVHTPSLLDEMRADWRQVLVESVVLGLGLAIIGAALAFAR